MASSTKTYQITNRTRTEWRGSTQSVSLDPRAMNAWNTCAVCLHAARDPHCCPGGDVFCKECILEHILSNTELRREKQQKAPDEAEIEMFLRNQRIAPGEPKERSGGAKAQSSERKRVRCHCPACRRRVKWRDMLPLAYEERREGPVCCGCERVMGGSERAERLECGHVVCSDCFTQMVAVDKQCPKCGQRIPHPEESILLNRTLLSKIDASGRITIKAEGLISSFG